MASVPVLMQRIRRARRVARQQSATGQFERYEDAYDRILRAVDDCAGEDPMDQLGAWAVEYTEREGRLPSPDRLREQAREICEKRSVEIPEESPLSG